MADDPTLSEARRQAEVVSEFLPPGYTAEFDGGAPASAAEAGASVPAPEAAEDQTSAEEPAASSLKLQGGDMHRDLFKTAARIKMHKRAATFHAPLLQAGEDQVGDDDETMPVSDQLAPGGFRRAFIQQRHRNEFLAARIPVTRNFVEFLDLYGSFAGEDLDDSDDELAVDDGEEEADEEGGPNEDTPLIRGRRAPRPPRAADADMLKTFFTLLKAFVGTGIMFLPKAFNNGGILFSSITLVTISLVTMLAFHLLLQCKKVHRGGYGEIGEAIAGKRMRGLILASITLSQLGFVASGIVFTAENLTSFFEAVVDGDSPFSTTALVLFQLAILIPLAFIRNISKLGPAALLADVFILIGVAYIYYYDIASLATDGLNKTVVLFNPDKYTLTIGAAIFTFEGIGLILPIESSMKKPEKFEWLLGVVMLIITVIFTAVGALCYATFGTDTKIEIINNYPQDSKFVNAVQFLYSLAVLVGTPVQLFPAVRIIEGKIFGRRSGKKSIQTKWKKNAFRAALTIFCGVVAILGAGNLDRFVALIGSVACVPLVYMYPPYLHFRGVATTWYAKLGDVIFMLVGLVCMVYTTSVTVVNSFM